MANLPSWPGLAVSVLIWCSSQGMIRRVEHVLGQKSARDSNHDIIYLAVVSMSLSHWHEVDLTSKLRF